MARIAFCNACQLGDHKRHQRVVRAVSEGMMGGVICDCKGECRDPKIKAANRDRILGPLKGLFGREDPGGS